MFANSLQTIYKFYLKNILLVFVVYFVVLFDVRKRTIYAIYAHEFVNNSVNPTLITILT